MLFANRIEEATKNCQALIQQKSYPDQEGEMANATETMVQHYQFSDIHVDKYNNTVGGIADNQPGKTLALDGYINTISVNEEKWSCNPYGDDIEDSRIYGRGTTDMKGAVAAMISAVGFFGQDNRWDFAGKIYIVCIVYEGYFRDIAARLANKHRKSDYVIIGKASELNLKIDQRGHAEVVIETFGKSAHSANLQVGINAVYKMAQLINKIRTITPPTHPVLGSDTLEPADIKPPPYPGASVIPDYCRATYGCRLLVGETKESVIVPLENVPAELIARDPQFKARASHMVGQKSCYADVTIEGECLFPGWIYDEPDGFVQAALVGIREAGSNPTTTQYSFCTNGSHYAGGVGIKTVGFGLSRENPTHTVDEYIEIDQLAGSASGYCSVIRALYCQ